MSKLSLDQITVSMATVPAWKQEGAAIVRTFTLPNFSKAMEFTNAVAKAAENANHHPDIEIKWNKVTLRLSTHSEGGLTEKDFALAGKFDQLTK
ncbi:MAG: putative pterin-4-alpha-carbinolamine dehydratase [Verrucomicrobia bacterium]|jgi:4a-hydroxytetrahydrobiopterin dehydratase|nr:putative pterin-4-alpha-carbinolamine dehydratase [Verrucomicrobiota bacterium]